MHIEEATERHWPAIWPVFAAIVDAGQTYVYDRDMPADQARDMWLLAPPGRTVVALDGSGALLGTAKMGPNHGGPGSHVATASFLVDPAKEGRGVGRALGEHLLEWATGAGYRAVQFNAVGPTPGRWRCGAHSGSRCWRRCPRPSPTRSTATSGCT